jgi:hypothetical protein
VFEDFEGFLADWEQDVAGGGIISKLNENLENGNAHRRVVAERRGKFRNHFLVVVEVGKPLSLEEDDVESIELW